MILTFCFYDFSAVHVLVLKEEEETIVVQNALLLMVES
jgi:hypothetical protein